MSGFLQVSEQLFLLSLSLCQPPHVINSLCLLHSQRREMSLYSFLWHFLPFLPEPFSCCWAVVLVHMLLWDQLTHSHQQVALQMNTQYRPEWYVPYLCLLSFTYLLSAQQKWQDFARLSSRKSTELLCEYKLICANNNYIAYLLWGWLSRRIKPRTKELDFFLANMAGINLHSVIIHYFSFQ